LLDLVSKPANLVKARGHLGRASFQNLFDGGRPGGVEDTPVEVEERSRCGGIRKNCPRTAFAFWVLSMLLA
jgi:hypothetical protein